jgi:hypothetical protein
MPRRKRVRDQEPTATGSPERRTSTCLTRGDSGARMLPRDVQHGPALKFHCVLACGMLIECSLCPGFFFDPPGARMKSSIFARLCTWPPSKTFRWVRDYREVVACSRKTKRIQQRREKPRHAGPTCVHLVTEVLRYRVWRSRGDAEHESKTPPQQGRSSNGPRRCCI